MKDRADVKPWDSLPWRVARKEERSIRPPHFSQLWVDQRAVKVSTGI
jgi:hypothetical protein